MKIIFVLAFGILITSSCGNMQDEKKLVLSTRTTPLPIKERISILFQVEAMQSFALSEKDEIRFFKSLPNSFEEFKDFYSKKYQLADGRKLYLSPSYHFNVLLPNLFFISKKNVIEKLLRISSNGYFVENKALLTMDTKEVKSLSMLLDATAIIQRSVQLLFASEAKTACKVLTGLSEHEILNFWKFYFYSAHPGNYQKYYEVLYARYKKIDPQIAELMKQSYEKLLSEHNGHGR